MRGLDEWDDHGAQRIILTELMKIVKKSAPEVWCSREKEGENETRGLLFRRENIIFHEMDWDGDKRRENRFMSVTDDTQTQKRIEDDYDWRRVDRQNKMRGFNVFMSHDMMFREEGVDMMFIWPSVSESQLKEEIIIMEIWWSQTKKYMYEWWNEWLHCSRTTIRKNFHFLFHIAKQKEDKRVWRETGNLLPHLRLSPLRDYDTLWLKSGGDQEKRVEELSNSEYSEYF